MSIKLRPDIKLTKGEGGKLGWYAGFKLSMSWESFGALISKLRYRLSKTNTKTKRP